jgi:hypothetical protein
MTKLFLIIKGGVINAIELLECIDSAVALLLKLATKPTLQGNYHGPC